MRIAVLSSGGKDSSAAWWWAICRGWDIVAVVTVDIQDGDSHMFQVPSTQWVEVQAKLADVPWLKVAASGTVEDEIHALENALSELAWSKQVLRSCLLRFLVKGWITHGSVMC